MSPVHGVASAFRKATEDEASGAGPAQPSIDASADAAPAPVVVETGPRRDCGASGLKRCGGNNGYGGTCDPGVTCQAGNNVCVANP